MVYVPVRVQGQEKTDVLKDRQKEKRVSEDEMDGWHHLGKLQEMVRDREA